MLTIMLAIMYVLGYTCTCDMCKNTVLQNETTLDRYLGTCICHSCSIDESYDIDYSVKVDSILPKEIMTIISYYITDPIVIFNCVHSNVFPPMGDKNYWVNRIHFYNPEVPIFIIKHNLVRKNHFYSLMLTCRRYDKEALFKDYIFSFQNNGIYFKSEQDKIKVLYYHHGMDHDGYCSDPDNLSDKSEYLEYTYTLPNGCRRIPKKIIEKIQTHYSHCYCDENTYAIISVLYINNNELLNEKVMRKIDMIPIELNYKKINKGKIKVLCNICNTKSYISGDYIYCSKCDGIIKS